jgi:hypothetical protein
MYGTFAVVTFVGVAAVAMFFIALVATASPLIAVIVTLITLAGAAYVMSRQRRRSEGGTRPAPGSLYESGRAAEREGGAVTDSTRRENPAAPGPR